MPGSYRLLPALLLPLLVGAPGCGRGAPPLLLLVTSDTLRADQLGAYGAPPEQTPRLDALFAESQVFRLAYAPSGHTLPSLSALMTGRHPEELGMLENASMMGSEFTTLASVLRLHGWRTAAVVSNFVLRRGTGVEHGFELYDDHLPDREPNRDVPERRAADTTEAALAALDRLAEPPGWGAFLWVHYQDPHGPYLPPAGRRERFLEAERDAAGGRRQLALDPWSLGLGSLPLYQYVEGRYDVAFYRAGYRGEIAYLDAEVGRLLDGVAARGRLAEAIVVFTADHGEGLGERDYWFAHGEYLTDPLVRVPLALRVPGRAPELRSDPASLLDLLPTLLALAQIDVPEGYPGRDLLAPGAEAAQPEIYLAALRGASLPRFGLVAEGYKYLATLRQGEAVEELYRLGDESRELGAERPGQLREMRERLERLRGELRRLPPRRQVLSDEERERLRRLGYAVD
jgi:arylsulfatase